MVDPTIVYICSEVVLKQLLVSDVRLQKRILLRSIITNQYRRGLCLSEIRIARAQLEYFGKFQ